MIKFVVDLKLAPNTNKIPIVPGPIVIGIAKGTTAKSEILLPSIFFDHLYYL